MGGGGDKELSRDWSFFEPEEQSREDESPDRVGTAYTELGWIRVMGDGRTSVQHERQNTPAETQLLLFVGVDFMFSDPSRRAWRQTYLHPSTFKGDKARHKTGPHARARGGCSTWYCAMFRTARGSRGVAVPAQRAQPPAKLQEPSQLNWRTGFLFVRITSARSQARRAALSPSVSPRPPEFWRTPSDDPPGAPGAPAPLTATTATGDTRFRRLAHCASTTLPPATGKRRGGERSRRAPRHTGWFFGGRRVWGGRVRSRRESVGGSLDCSLDVWIVPSIYARTAREVERERERQAV